LPPVTAVDQLRVGDSVRTSGNRLDYRVTKITATYVVITGVSNAGNPLLRVYLAHELSKGNLRKVNYS